MGERIEVGMKYQEARRFAIYGEKIRVDKRKKQRKEKWVSELPLIRSPK